MKILLTNDDGYKSIFLEMLYVYLVEKLKEHTVTVMAPRTNNSGVSQAITMGGKISYEKIQDNWYVVDGTPTDCVVVGTSAFPNIDMVISGPNAGSNLGQDTLYSGTVAAAREAVLRGIPAIAFSLSDESNSNLANFSKEKFYQFLNKWLIPFMHLAIDEQPNFINVNISKLETFDVCESKLSHRYYFGFKDHIVNANDDKVKTAVQQQSGVDDSRAPENSDWQMSLYGKSTYTVVSAWPQIKENTFEKLQQYKQEI